MADQNNNCPGCGGVLIKVTQSGDSMLNAEQFAAARLGDWFCGTCKGPDTRYRYFWNRDFAATPAVPAHSLTDEQIVRSANTTHIPSTFLMPSGIKPNFNARAFAEAIAAEVLAASQSVPAPDAPTDDDELFAAKYYSSARPAPDVGGLIPEQAKLDSLAQAGLAAALESHATSEQPNSTECHPDATHEPDKFDLALTEAGRIMAGEQMGGAQVAKPEQSAPNYGDNWHGLTCDGTCSPPCAEARPTADAGCLSPLQRYVWAGTPVEPLKHLTAHEGPFYACDDVRDFIAKSRAAEGAATSERKPMTDAIALLHRAKNAISQSEPERWSGITTDIDRYFEQHHGIGSAKND